MSRAEITRISFPRRDSHGTAMATPAFHSPNLHIENLGAEDDPGNDSRNAGNYEEHPHLREGFAAHQKRGSQAAGRIHGYSRDVDSENVDHNQRDSNRQAGHL